MLICWICIVQQTLQHMDPLESIQTVDLVLFYPQRQQSERFYFNIRNGLVDRKNSSWLTAMYMSSV